MSGRAGCVALSMLFTVLSAAAAQESSPETSVRPHGDRMLQGATVPNGQYRSYQGLADDGPLSDALGSVPYRRACSLEPPQRPG